jgi:hypothetical protein
MKIKHLLFTIVFVAITIMSLAQSGTANYNIILSDEEETWTQEYAFRLVETLKTIPYFSDVHELEKSTFVLTEDHLFEDITITNYGDTAKVVRISKDCFAYANPFLVNLDGVRGHFFSKRLHHALVNFATDFGNNPERVNRIISERFGFTTDVPDYSTLTANITNEDAGRFQPFNPDELVSIINMFEELPENFHKTPHLNYLLRRLNGQPHPVYPEAAAVAWCVDSGYIVFMETAFGGDVNNFEALRLILHEKTHFLWTYTFSKKIKNDWIRLGGWYRNPNSGTRWSTKKNTEFVSAYACAKNPDEDMAESLAHYLKNPELLQSRSLPKYKFIRDRIMNKRRYISKIPNHLTFEVQNLYPDYDYPKKRKRFKVNISDIQGGRCFEKQNDYIWKMYANHSSKELEIPEYEAGSLNYQVTDTIVEGRNAQNLQIIYRITDNIGILETYSAINRDGSAHSMERYDTYNAENHTATIDILMTEYQPSGYYWVASTFFENLAGNSQYIYFSDSPLDQPIQRVYIETPNPDTEAPEIDLNRITVYAEPTNPEALDGETSVTINYYAKDNKSGLGLVKYYLKDPQGILHANHHIHKNSYTTYFDGDPTVWEKYTINCVLPQGSVPGVWELAELHILDKVQNERSYNFVETLIFEPDNSFGAMAISNDFPLIEFREN